MKVLIVLNLLISLSGYASECRVEEFEDTFTDLNNITIEDNQIVTEADLRFCPDQRLSNHSITPDGLPDNGSVWRVGNRRWNDDWEKKYQNWVKDNITNTIFEELDFPTDCADAAIAIRSIFARINNLPVAFNGTHYTNQSKKYRNLKTVTHWKNNNWKENFRQDSRFKKSLGDWLTGTGTVNIHKDTYQVSVWDNKTNMPSACITPGTIVLHEGHVEILTFNKESIFPYRLSSSTVPAKVRPLEENIFSFGYQYLPEEEKYRDSRGYVWWNWPINCKGKLVKVKDEKMPYYSSEQADRDENSPSINYDFNQAYQDGLGLTKEELNIELVQEFDLLLQDIMLSIEERKKVVTEGLQVCSLNSIDSAKDCFYSLATKTYKGIQYKFEIQDDGLIKSLTDDNYDDSRVSCESCPPELPDALKAENLVETQDFSSIFKAKSSDKSNLYYELSTPSRDERLISRLSKLNELYYKQPNYEDVTLKLMDTKIELKNGKSISLYHLKRMYYLSPQPWDSEELRWGGAHMNEIKNEFYHYHKNFLQEYEKVKSSYTANPTDENLSELENFKENSKLLIAEKALIDDYFLND